MEEANRFSRAMKAFPTPVTPTVWEVTEVQQASGSLTVSTPLGEPVDPFMDPFMVATDAEVEELCADSKGSGAAASSPKGSATLLFVDDICTVSSQPLFDDGSSFADIRDDFLSDDSQEVLARSMPAMRDLNGTVRKLSHGAVRKDSGTSCTDSDASGLPPPPPSPTPSMRGSVKVPPPKQHPHWVTRLSETDIALPKTVSPGKIGFNLPIPKAGALAQIQEALPESEVQYAGPVPAVPVVHTSVGSLDDPVLRRAMKKPGSAGSSTPKTWKKWDQNTNAKWSSSSGWF